MGEKSGNAIQSIRESLLRVVEHGYDQVSGDAIIIATVTETFSDALDIETFGTMTCFDNKSKIEIDEIPLNAHIGDDGNTALSGKYTFPKIGSDVYLLRDVDDAHERYICILFSHVESVLEVYNTSKTTKLIEVDTPDPDEPYETEETGNNLEEVVSPKEYYRAVNNDGVGGSSITQNFDKTTSSVGDSDGGGSVTQTSSSLSSQFGSSGGTSTGRIQDNGGQGEILDTVSYQGVASSVSIKNDSVTAMTQKYTINTGTAAAEESAVLGDTLVDVLADMNTLMGLINAAIPTSAVYAGYGVDLAAINLKISTMLATNIKLK